MLFLKVLFLGDEETSLRVETYSGQPTSGSLHLEEKEFARCDLEDLGRLQT